MGLGATGSQQAWLEEVSNVHLNWLTLKGTLVRLLSVGPKASNTIKV